METSIAQATTRSGSGTAFSTATTIAPDRAGTTTTPPPQQHPTDDPAATLDIRSLTYLSQLDDHILCPICKTPFLNPITTPCRHTFCADCLATALAATDAPPTCPIDRGPLRPEDTRPAPIVVANLVDGLLVACPNAGKGCMVGCARYLVEGHLREECGYVEVACPGEGCKERVLRKDLRERCLHGIVECEFCLDRVREMDLKSHRQRCPGLSDTCPHCSQEFSRADLSSHIPKCPSELVQCPSSRYGCPFVCPRKELSDHADECAFTLLAPILQSHEEQLAALTRENKALKRKLDILLPPRTGFPRDSSDPSDPSSSSSAPNNTTTAQSALLDEQTYHLLSEQEHLRTSVEHLSSQIIASEMKQSALLMNETLRLKEELAAMRSAVAGMRMQMHWLLSNRISHGVQQWNAMQREMDAAEHGHQGGPGQVPPPPRGDPPRLPEAAGYGRDQQARRQEPRRMSENVVKL